MSFVAFADGTANLPGRLLDGIKLLPIAYTVNGVPDTYNGDIEDFDVHAYYEQLRGGADFPVDHSAMPDAAQGTAARMVSAAFPQGFLLIHGFRPPFI